MAKHARLTRAASHPDRGQEFVDGETTDDDPLPDPDRIDSLIKHDPKILDWYKERITDEQKMRHEWYRRRLTLADNEQAIQKSEVGQENTRLWFALVCSVLLLLGSLGGAIYLMLEDKGGGMYLLIIPIMFGVIALLAYAKRGRPEGNPHPGAAAGGKKK